MLPTEEEITDQFPDLFDYYHRDPDEIAGPTPQICLYGFQHEQGWNHLVLALCERLKQRGIDTRIVQIKEKFGGLRFYTEGIEGDDIDVQLIFGAIQQTGTISRHICERCGCPASTIEDNGYIRTLCGSCRN